MIEIIDKHRKKCHWRGSDFRKKGYNLAVWNLVRAPKEKGGLGVINLSVHNDALLLKHLDKFFRKDNIQWVNLIWQKYYPDGAPHVRRERGSFWWKDILRLHVQYRGITCCMPGKGDTIRFWDDLFNGAVHSQRYPLLFEFAKDSRLSLQQVREADSLLSSALEFLCLDRPIMNSWIWIQSSSKCLQTAMRRMTVGFLSGETSIILQASTIDISSPLCIHLKPLFGSGRENVSQRLNSFFAWLLLNDRLNTRNLLSRRKKFLEEGYCCVLCQNDLEETSEHLFFF